jgi:predicted RNase H-like nuclease (RuvC/YqgF family)
MIFELYHKNEVMKMNLNQLKMELDQARWNSNTELFAEVNIYRLLTLSKEAIEKLEDKLGNKSEEIEILA